MFSYIVGKITDIEENYITLDCNGVGFELFVSSKAKRIFETVDGEVKVYTYLKQSEDGVCLYGFYDKDEKEMFLKLISVSGVGPKGAIAILSNISVADLSVVIASQDAQTLSGVKGIGKKTAERLIVELKGKVTALEGAMQENISYNENKETEDAVQVLVSLGVNKMEASRLVQSVYEDGDTAETIIGKALNSMR